MPFKKMKKTSVGKNRCHNSKFDKFLKNGLKIEPDDIEVADIFRLPQYPIMKNGKKVHRPIIVKLVYNSDKNLIFSSL